MTTAEPVRMVSCPSCGEPTRFEPANVYRPFCSARCKGLDFGAWASENHRLPDESPTDLDDFEQKPLQ